MVGHPVKYSATPVEKYSSAPSLGQHTREVLGELLGLDADALDLLATQAVI
jgi:crotonobetainyl-CoA:carnitine CoA-transferase CaiB-like acyl-CoA transferase